MSSTATTEVPRLTLAISACLLGDNVRFNGGHKQSSLCSTMLSQYFDFAPLCPEMAIGLGVPREPIRLVGNPQAPRAVGSVHPDRDVTTALIEYGNNMAAQLPHISGLIVMQKSPSCGMERVKVYQDGGRPAERGEGVFTRAFSQQRPNVPIEEEGRLNDPVLRENFIVRVYAYGAWQALCAQGLTREGLISFHARYKYVLMAHDAHKARLLGRLLGEMSMYDLPSLADRYFTLFMQALKKCATRGTHTNVLHHMLGFLRDSLPADDRAEIQHLIEQYHQGIVPLVVPLTMLKSHFRRHPDAYIALQVYLQPYPEQLSLRNSI